MLYPSEREAYRVARVDRPTDHPYTDTGVGKRLLQVCSLIEGDRSISGFPIEKKIRTKQRPTKKGSGVQQLLDSFLAGRPCDDRRLGGEKAFGLKRVLEFRSWRAAGEGLSQNRGSDDRRCCRESASQRSRSEECGPEGTASGVEEQHCGLMVGVMRWWWL